MKDTLTAKNMTVAQIVAAVKNYFKKHEEMEEITLEMQNCAVKFNTQVISYSKESELTIPVTLNRYMTEQEMYDTIVNALNKEKNDQKQNEESM